MSDLHFKTEDLPEDMFQSLQIIWEDATHEQRGILLALEGILASTPFTTISNDEDLAVNVASLFDHRFNAFVVEAVEAVRVELFG